MTPTPDDKRASGNPATQAKIAQTVKQQREQKRQEKLAEYQKQLAKRRRSKIVWWAVGGVAAVTVIGVVVASIVFAPAPPPTFEANGSTGREIEGVETFENETTHVEGEVDYAQSPPAGGPHNAYWLNCAVYSEPQVNENAVHSLEHGAIWVTYDAAAVNGEELDALKAQLPSSYVILSPYEGLDSPIVLSGWNSQLKLDSADDPRIAEFFTEYWRSQNVPEPGALCSGAVDGPGKQ
ncbi:DUF3105 domain-containing protein [Microbacterium sp. RU33B]|uniref:DUF3105 domain-containing protein n=1 Tax=Microbacterium sp. RU33B TaxID=1907390 RepID=UPI00095D6A0C|nr:DUF3105 domain-containing protein [Microbacterium sp. RU33B]SIT68755.1 Protein of unknown function [Microbacterium sp. RU33B]